MKKTCFVIMPISDHPDYAGGHFNRVYNGVIKKACEIAGFLPVRADEVQHTDYIILSIIDQIVNADMAICDLSTKNPNVLYELGIRQAFNKPVTLIKDRKTPRMFDIAGFRDIEYDELLRYDSVEESINAMAASIKATYEQKPSSNSLINMLSIKSATITDSGAISRESATMIGALEDIYAKVIRIEEIVASNVSTRQDEKNEKNEKLDTDSNNKFIEILVDLSDFTGTEQDSVFPMIIYEDASFRNLLDMIYFAIARFAPIKPFTYGFDWILMDTNTRQFFEIGLKKPKFQAFNDDRRIKTLGINGKSRLAAKKLAGDEDK